MSQTAIYAAGGVLWRVVGEKLRVAVVHRLAYGDVSLPKGKVDPGETLAETATREMYEETGIRACLGVPVGVSHYTLPGGKSKIVHYWSMHATDEAIRVSTFVPNKEIAALEWLSPRKARARLSYPADVEILENFLRLVDDGVLHTFPLVVLRHAKATARADWNGADTLRPLTDRGAKQAKAVAGPLSAFGVRKIISSDAVRCVTTVVPLAAALSRKIHRTPAISQDAWEDGESDVRGVVGRRIRSGKPAVVCSHGPVLPAILHEAALATGTVHGSYLDAAAALPVGAFSVVHISATNPGSGIIAIETHEPKL